MNLDVVFFAVGTFGLEWHSTNRGGGEALPSLALAVRGPCLCRVWLHTQSAQPSVFDLWWRYDHWVVYIVVTLIFTTIQNQKSSHRAFFSISQERITYHKLPRPCLTGECPMMTSSLPLFYPRRPSIKLSSCKASPRIPS